MTKEYKNARTWNFLYLSTETIEIFFIYLQKHLEFSLFIYRNTWNFPYLPTETLRISLFNYRNTCNFLIYLQKHLEFSLFIYRNTWNFFIYLKKRL